MTIKILSKLYALVYTSTVVVAAHICMAQAPDATAVPDGLKIDAFPRLRGFTIKYNADETVMDEVANNYHANAVRLMLRPYLPGSNTSQNRWERMLEKLPSQVEAARKNGIYVIVALFGPPIEGFKDKYDRDRRAFSHEFWTDEANLNAMIDQAVQTAMLLEPYEGQVWLELRNEPIDWTEFPSPVSVWPVWSQQIIDAVREVSDIPIVVQVGPGGLCWGYKTFPLLEGENIIYSVHNYQPHAYTHQGIKNISGTDLAHSYEMSKQPWPGVFSDGGGDYWDKERLRKELEPAIKFAEEHHVRMYVGEFGVARWAPNADDYLRDNIELFEELGWDWTYHAYRESAIWSPEHDSEFTRPAQLATKETERAKVLKEYMEQNTPFPRNQPEASKTIK